jgi:hypothetical protein
VFHRTLGLSGMAVVAAMSGGCMNGVLGPDTGGSTTVSNVAAKAVDVASQVGGANGFGGALMDGYLDHMPSHMGFQNASDLAPDSAHMMVLLRNDSELGGTFHMSYFASPLGFDEHMMDVAVPAGDEVTVEIPCSEIVGMGSLDSPGSVGCALDDGETVDNVMAVPGFLGDDFACGGVYGCVLEQDVNDLDGDGDTTELIILSDAMSFHMMNGGPMGHTHGTEPGMMGPHMGL